MKTIDGVKERQNEDSHPESKSVNLDIMKVLGKNSGLLPVTTAEAMAMDPFRRRLLIPLVTLTPSIPKTKPKKRVEREPTETIDRDIPVPIVEIKKRASKVQPNYVDVTGITPPESYIKDGVRVPCEPIKPYNGATIKEALDNLLEDIRKERRARVGSPELLDHIKCIIRVVGKKERLRFFNKFYFFPIYTNRFDFTYT